MGGRKMKKIAAIIVALFMGVFMIQAVNAKTIWKWVDKNGNVHFVDSASKVPVKYRKKVVKVEMPDDDQNIIGESKKIPPPDTELEEPKDDKGRGERYWRNKAAVARKSLKKAKAMMDNRNAAFDSAYQAWLQLPVQQNRNNMEKIRKQRSQARKEHKKAQNYLDRGLPKEARKAGALPGWLRDSPGEKHEKMKKKKKMIKSDK